jgi:hypothetical protein
MDGRNLDHSRARLLTEAERLLRVYREMLETTSRVRVATTLTIARTCALIAESRKLLNSSGNGTD